MFSKTNDIKIAIIGTGVIGNLHAKVLSNLGMTVSALCDVDAKKAENVRQKYANDAKIYTDWRLMLKEFSPDIVHICTPHDLHAEMTVTALDSNIHVLCEKPLCINNEEIERVLQAEKRSCAKLGVCHQNRYNAVNRFLKDYLADKKIVGAHGSVVWERTKSYYESADWRGTIAHEGGGVLINQALHTFDLMMWLCGEPKSISATSGNLTLREEIEVEDTIAIRCFGDTDYTFFATVGSGCDMPVEMNFKLESGEYVVAFPKTVIVDGKVLEKDEINHFFKKECYGDGHIHLIDDFYHCLKNDDPFSINGIEAAKVIRMIIAAYQSKGEKITL